VQLETDLAALEKAVEAGDKESFRLVAHRLKGMSANVSAWPLHQCAKEAEELARSSEIDDLAQQLERFQEMREQISTVLKSR
jgi:HPt (histidine-containing phosphotransfer) domain-containing protein